MVKDDKTSVKVEVSDVKKKEVEYKEVEYKEPANKKAKTVSMLIVRYGIRYYLYQMLLVWERLRF